MQAGRQGQRLHNAQHAVYKCYRQLKWRYRIVRFSRFNITQLLLSLMPGPLMFCVLVSTEWHHAYAAITLGEWDRSALDERTGLIEVRGTEPMEVWRSFKNQTGFRSVLALPEDPIIAPTEFVFHGTTTSNTRDFLNQFKSAFAQLDYTQDQASGIIWIYPISSPYASLMTTQIRVMKSAASIPLASRLSGPLSTLGHTFGLIITPWTEMYNYDINIKSGTYVLKDLLNSFLSQKPYLTLILVEKADAPGEIDLGPDVITDFPGDPVLSPGLARLMSFYGSPVVSFQDARRISIEWMSDSHYETRAKGRNVYAFPNYEPISPADVQLTSMISRVYLASSLAAGYLRPSQGDYPEDIVSELESICAQSSSLSNTGAALIAFETVARRQQRRQRLLDSNAMDQWSLNSGNGSLTPDELRDAIRVNGEEVQRIDALPDPFANLQAREFIGEDLKEIAPDLWRIAWLSPGIREKLDQIGPSLFDGLLPELTGLSQKTTYDEPLFQLIP